MTKETRKRMIATSGLLVIAGVGGILLIDWLLGADLFRAVGLVQAVVTSLAIGVGGVFAFYKFELFREFQPHLTITQEVTHRAISAGYVHISVTATLVNAAKVATEIRSASFRLQQLAPLGDDEIETLYGEFLDKDEIDKYFDFPVYDEYRRVWFRGEFIVELGESESETYEFIVRGDLLTASLDVLFSNAENPSEHGDDKGWAARTVYDIN